MGEYIFDTGIQDTLIYAGFNSSGLIPPECFSGFFTLMLLFVAFVLGIVAYVSKNTLKFFIWIDCVFFVLTYLTMDDFGFVGTFIVCAVLFMIAGTFLAFHTSPVLILIAATVSILVFRVFVGIFSLVYAWMGYGIGYLFESQKKRENGLV